MKVKEVKKYYISPVVEAVSCVPGTFIAASLEIGGDGDQSSEGEFEGEAADEYRGSWEGIWDNM